MIKGGSKSSRIVLPGKQKFRAEVCTKVGSMFGDHLMQVVFHQNRNFGGGEVGYTEDGEKRVVMIWVEDMPLYIHEMRQKGESPLSCARCYRYETTEEYKYRTEKLVVLGFDDERLKKAIEEKEAKLFTEVGVGDHGPSVAALCPECRKAIREAQEAAIRASGVEAPPTP